MARVIKGEYVGCEVNAVPKEHYLLINMQGEQIPITKNFTKSCLLKACNPEKTQYIYSIEWVDGSRSLIKIPEEWRDILLSGCHMGKSNAEESSEDAPLWAKVLRITLIVIIILFIINGICNLFLKMIYG